MDTQAITIALAVVVVVALATLALNLVFFVVCTSALAALYIVPFILIFWGVDGLLSLWESLCKVQEKRKARKALAHTELSPT